MMSFAICSLVILRRLCKSDSTKSVDALCLKYLSSEAAVIQGTLSAYQKAKDYTIFILAAGFPYKVQDPFLNNSRTWLSHQAWLDMISSSFGTWRENGGIYVDFNIDNRLDQVADLDGY